MNLLKFKPNYKNLIDSLEWAWDYYKTSGEVDLREITCMVAFEKEFYEEYMIDHRYSDEEIDEVLDQMGFSA